LQRLLKEEGIDCNYDEHVKYRHYIFSSYKQEDGFDMGLYVQ